MQLSSAADVGYSVTQGTLLSEIGDVTRIWNINVSFCRLARWLVDAMLGFADVCLGCRMVDHTACRRAIVDLVRTVAHGTWLGAAQPHGNSTWHVRQGYRATRQFDIACSPGLQGYRAIRHGMLARATGLQGNSTWHVAQIHRGCEKEIRVGRWTSSTHSCSCGTTQCMASSH